MTRGRQHTGRVLTKIVLAFACAAITIPAAMAQISATPPATPTQPTTCDFFIARSFTQSPPRVFGDSNNSWTQAMIWWKGNL